MIPPYNPAPAASNIPISQASGVQTGEHASTLTLRPPPPAALKSSGLLRRQAPSWLKREFTVKQNNGEFTVKQNNDEVLHALAVLGSQKNGQPILTGEMINAALASTEKDKLEALGVLASHGTLDVEKLAMKVFSCKEEELRFACSTGLAFGDRTKLNAVKLLLNQEIVEPYVDEGERIAGLPSLSILLIRTTQSPPHEWAENQSPDFPDREERLHTIFGVERGSQKKYEIFRNIAPALELEQADREKVDTHIAYHTDTHGIECGWQLIWAMRDLGYKLSDNEFRRPIPQDIYERVQNERKNFSGAIQHFQQVCELPSDSLSNSFQKLVAHLNLLSIYRDDKFRQPEEDGGKNAMQAMRQALDCARTIPEKYLTHQGVQKVTAEIYKATLSSWKSLSKEEQNRLEQDSVQLMQTNMEFLEIARASFYKAIFRPKFLSNPDIRSRNEFAALLINAEEKAERRSDFRMVIWTQQWKNVPTIETLENLLKISYASPLEYFDLFQHAQDSEAKQKIAQKVASNHKSLFEQARLDNYYQIPAEKVLSMYGLSMVCTYHLLQKTDSSPSLYFLKHTLWMLGTCADFLRRPAFHEQGNLRAHYKENDIQLLVNIAFQAKSVQAELSSAPFVATLCEKRDPAFQEEVHKWAREVRYGYDGLKNARSSSRYTNSEFHQIHENFAQHCRDEFTRTEV